VIVELDLRVLAYNQVEISLIRRTALSLVESVRPLVASGHRISKTQVLQMAATHSCRKDRA